MKIEIEEADSFQGKVGSRGVEFAHLVREMKDGQVLTASGIKTQKEAERVRAQMYWAGHAVYGPGKVRTVKNQQADGSWVAQLQRKET